MDSILSIHYSKLCAQAQLERVIEPVLMYTRSGSVQCQTVLMVIVKCT
jgi:hypothetical protein